MSRLSPHFKERVMAKIDTHERMAALYRKALAEGFHLARGPARRGILFSMPAGLRAGDAPESGAPDPRFGTVANLMEHEGEMFDFIEASDRLAEAVLSDGEAPPTRNGTLGLEGLEPLSAGERHLPLVAGGQGRGGEDLVTETKAVLLVGGGLLALGLVVAAAAGLLS